MRYDPTNPDAQSEPVEPVESVPSDAPDAPSIIGFATPNETLAAALNRFYARDRKHPKRRHYGDTYQNGVMPGAKRLEQFVECLKLRGVPLLYVNDGQGYDALAHIKLFDPCGSWSWFITEWSGGDASSPNECFGLVIGHEEELGYIDLNELAFERGRMGIGIELDMHWTPRPLTQCTKKIVALRPAQPAAPYLTPTWQQCLQPNK